MLLSIDGLEKSFGDKKIFTDVSFTVEDRDRIGLIGVNGAGKTTLLNIITRKILPDAGEIYRSKQLRTGFLEQHSGLDSSKTIAQEMESVFKELITMQKRIEKLSKEMNKNQESVDEYARLQTQFEQKDGYLIQVKINTILNGMGFGGKDSQMPVQKLSGGEKTRLALAKLLLEEPNLLILDEPTNHLDFKTLSWLENYLTDYNGAILVVSHDRYFLDKIVTSVCELEWGKIVRYPGNYTKYRSLRKERKERLEKEYIAQQKEITAMEEYVRKNIARASTAASAKGRRKALERMEIIKKPDGDVKPICLRFHVSSRPFKEVLQLEDVSVVVGGKKQLCQHISLEILRGEKVALIGENGIGKSSLLKTLLNQIPKGSGKIRWGENVKASFYEQENSTLHPHKRVIDEFWDRFPGMTEWEVRTALGAVQLTGENVYKPVCVISGGEKARLAFSIIMQENSNVLLLDEPTNHLDLLSKEILEKALNEYEGTLLFVSHDRYLLNKVPHKIVEIHSRGIREYAGKYDDYLAQTERENISNAQDKAKEKPAIKAQYRTKAQRSLEVKQRNRLKEIEKNIDDKERQIMEHEKKLTSEEVYSDYIKAKEIADTIESYKQQIVILYQEWEELSALLE